MRISDWSSDVCSSDLRRRAPRRPQDDELSARIGQPDPRPMALAPAQLPRCHAQEGQRLFGLRCPDEETLSLPRLMRQGGKTTGGGSMVGRVWNSDAEAAPARARSEEHTSELQSLMRI